MTLDEAIATLRQEVEKKEKLVGRIRDLGHHMNMISKMRDAVLGKNSMSFVAGGFCIHLSNRDALRILDDQKAIIQNSLDEILKECAS